MKYEKLIVMPDFSSSGIWNDHGMIEFENLNLSEELIKEFEDWIEFYDVECHDYLDYSFKEEMEEELNKRGRELARKLKLLFPDIQIMYRGETKKTMIEEIII
jgi:hypothetical protein